MLPEHAIRQFHAVLLDKTGPLNDREAAEPYEHMLEAVEIILDDNSTPYREGFADCVKFMNSYGRAAAIAVVHTAPHTKDFLQGWDDAHGRLFWVTGVAG